MGDIGGIVGGYFQGEATQAAAEKNYQAQLATEANRLRMFRESRGDNGLPVFQPLYSGGLESGILHPAAVAAFKAAYPTTDAERQQKLAAFAALQAGITPSFDAAGRTIGDIFSGGLTSERVAGANPVAAARTAKGATTRGAIMEGLKERLAAIGAQRARAGYTGGGTAAELPLLRSTIGARQAGSDAEAQAALENAQIFQAIRDQGLNLKLSSLDLPASRLAQSIQFMQMPQEALINSYLSAIRPLEKFNINPTAYQPGAAPVFQGVGSPLGTALARAGGSDLNTLANWYANNQIKNMYTSAGLANAAASPAMTNAAAAGMLPAASSSAIDWAAFGA